MSATFAGYPLISSWSADRDARTPPIQIGPKSRLHF